MNRRRFVLASSLILLVVTAGIAGLAFYSDIVAKAFHQNLPDAINYLPADTQAVFGMNVQKFVNSPAYALIMQKHGQEIGTNLSEFVDQTGVDPRQDIDYIIAAGRASQQKGAGVIIAVGRFKPDQITNFINSHVTPIRVDYNGATVLMIPEKNASEAKLDKGIAFLNTSQIALGDLDSLHAVLDLYNRVPGAASNSTLTGMVSNLDPKEMFWFAGDSSILSQVPAKTQFLPTSISAIQNVFGTLDLTTNAGSITSINGKVTVTAKDDKSASQLGDFARGILALGGLAGGQNPDLAQLISGVQISPNPQNASQLTISLNIPYDLLQKLGETKDRIKAVMK